MKVEATTPKDDQRENIIAAARQVFGQYGYKKATLDIIGQSMGKVKSFVYYYFKGKEQLFEAVIDSEVQHLKSEFDQILTSDMPATEKLKVYTKKRMALIFQLANYYELVSNGMLTNPAFTEKLRRKYDDKEVEHILLILEQGIRSGEFCLKDVQLAAIAYFTVLKGLEIPLFTAQDHSSNVDQRIDNLLTIIFNGILSK